MREWGKDHWEPKDPIPPPRWDLIIFAILFAAVATVGLIATMLSGVIAW